MGYVQKAISERPLQHYGQENTNSSTTTLRGRKPQSQKEQNSKKTQSYQRCFNADFTQSGISTASDNKEKIARFCNAKLLVRKALGSYLKKVN